MAFFDISLETANKFYTWGWKASLAGAAITLIGVAFLMWGTRIRDHDSETRLGQTTLSSTAAVQHAEAAIARAAKAERDLFDLRQSIRPRMLSNEQRDSLINALTVFNGQRLEIIEYKLSAEASAFSSQIQSALLLAHWDARVTGQMGGTGQREGVTIMIDLGETNVVASALTSELRKVGITKAFLANDDFLPVKLGHGVIGMIVGPKP